MDMKIVTVEMMKSIELKANEAGFSYPKMMEKAGKGLANFVFDQMKHVNDQCTIIGLVGPGNNGGDTLIALCELAKKSVETFAFCYKRDVDKDELCNELLTTGGKVFTTEKMLLDDVLVGAESEIIYLLDGFLGTGFHLPIEADLKDFLHFLKTKINKGRTTIIAVDCPSGVDCDTGEVDHAVIKADHTICMAAIKTGLLAFPAFEYTGQLHIVSIGIENVLKGWNDGLPGVIGITDAARILPVRPNNSHKGSFGKVLVVGGSINYCGSVLLSAEAAYRSGSGLVTLGVTESVYSAIAGQIPEATWTLLPGDMGCITERAVNIILDLNTAYDCVLLGPGLGVNDSTERFVRALIDSFKHKPAHKIGFVTNEAVVRDTRSLTKSMVIDADGLKCLHPIKEWWKKLPKDVVITPHPGEMSILISLSVDEIQANRIEIAKKYASEWNVTIVLKGALTVIADPKGKISVLPIADSSLAHAGTGDVLAGMIASFIGQGLSGYEAAVLSCYLHAKAGEKAREVIGHPAAVLSRDVISSIGNCIQALEQKK